MVSENIIYKTLAIYSLFLAIIGTIGNIFTCCLCLRRRLRSISTFVLLSLMTISDTLSLFCWNIDHFIYPFYGVYQEYTNLGWCRVIVFLQFFSLQCSAWLLVSVAVERYLSVKVKNWRKILFKPKHALVLGLSVSLVIFLINSHLLITNGYVEERNGTNIVFCYESKYIQLFPLWEQIHGAIYSFLPFALLLIFNILLIRQTVIVDTNSVVPAFNNNVRRRKSITFTIFWITISFFILTTPSAIAGGYFGVQLSTTINGQIILFVCDILTFSYHALNFIALPLLNKEFRRECRDIFMHVLGNHKENTQRSIGTTRIKLNFINK